MDIHKELDKIETELKKKEAERRQQFQPDGRYTSTAGFIPAGAEAAKDPGALALRGPGECKSLESMFGPTNRDGWKSAASWFAAAQSGKYHPDLRTISEGTGNLGGYVVPTEYANDIHVVALEQELVMPRCFVQPMKSNEMKVGAAALGDHGSSLYGGFQAFWESETGTLTEANPTFREMTLTAKKLTGLLKYSNEWREDSPNSEKNIKNLCGGGLAWYRDKAFLKGDGVGKPLGILNAPCLLSVEKEIGQVKETLVYENLVKCFAKIHPACIKNAVWIISQSAIPQLLTLAHEIGLGGSTIPVMSETDGSFKILTRPVIFTEKTEPLGTKGDILLADLSQYICGLRSDLRYETSNGPGFTTDEVYARLISRVAGQPLWSKAITLESGGQVSPFVTLDTRA